MQIESSSKIPGLKLIKPPVHYDYRGEYVMTFSTLTHQFTDLNDQPITFVEDDISMSRQNVLRGLHGDQKTWKLIQCLYGEFYYVVVDMRKDLPSYKTVQTFVLNERNRYQVLVPAGCANGHLVLSERCIFSYKQSEHYQGMEKQFTVHWNDPDLNIVWPTDKPILSDRDKSATLIRDWQ